MARHTLSEDDRIRMNVADHDVETVDDEFGDTGLLDPSKTRRPEPTRMVACSCGDVRNVPLSAFDEIEPGKTVNCSQDPGDGAPHVVVEMLPVTSSHVIAVAFVPSIDFQVTQVGSLRVLFSSGVLGEYGNVSQKWYHAFLFAESKGKFLTGLKRAPTEYPWRKFADLPALKRPKAKL